VAADVTEESEAKEKNNAGEKGNAFLSREFFQK
jgi:hypothetical protein